MRENPVLPTISVIVPVHNGQDYLKNCIDSILAQTYRPLEIIIVNDGSADRTGEICAGLENAHENIFTVEVKDVGVSAARNAGLDRARGEYVTFVDADDRIHPEMLTVLYQNLARTGSDISGCGFFAWQTEGEWEKGISGVGPEDVCGVSAMQEMKESARQDVRLFTQKEFVLDGILKNDTRCWSKLYKRECVQNVRFREGLTIGEDMFFLIDLLPNVRQSVTADFQGYGYFQNPHGAMNRSFKPSYMDQIECWKLAGEALAEWMAGQAAGADRKERPGNGARTNGGERAVCQEQRLTAQERAFVEETIAARQMIGIMLTVGKLAELSGRERKANRQYVQICRQRLKECLAAGKGLAGLDRGYRVKVRLFAVMPGAYVRLYGSLKRWSKKL